MRRVRGLLALGVVFLTAACAAAVGAPAGAAQLQATCQLALTRLEPNTANTLLLDTSAVYWLVSYHAVPGSRIKITGQFPHARYISWNLYDVAARPADALSDVQIEPDPGSHNPFRPGARRTVRRRSYTLWVQFTAKPAHPAPDTLYAGSGAANLEGTLWYRVYVPDRGADIEGGVPLPSVTVDLGGPALPAPLPASDGCATLQAPSPPQLQEAFRDSDGVPLPDQTAAVGYPGRNPPNWRLFANFSLAFTDILTDNAYTDPLDVIAHGLPTSDPSNPGIFADKNDAYIYAATSQGFGKILVLHGRAPTFANTARPARRMPAGEQVRYFSMCEYEPAEMRVIDCARDDQTVLRHGLYTYVISTPQDRPANATARCGVTWIAQGPAPYGLLILRNLLASPTFVHSTARIGTPGREQQVMGRYYPTGEYLPDKQAFEQRGCRR